MDPAADGTPLTASPASSAPDYPHAKALAGACRALERAHVPFGVITARQLADLARYQVVVLADATRLTRDEVAAFRTFVAKGGRLYASGRSTLRLADASGGEDFALADLFGCNAVRQDGGELIYIRAESQAVHDAIAPERFVTYPGPAVRLADDAGGEVLARLTLSYGHPHRGSVEGENWASIHSSPPWHDEQAPTIVHNRFGSGEAIYSAAPIERSDGGAGERLFLALIDRLLPRPSLVTDAPSSIAVTLFQVSGGLTVFLLNQESRPWTKPVRLQVRLPAGVQARGALLGGVPLPCTLCGREEFICTIPEVTTLAALSILFSEENL
jgi:hypothetical protein